MTLQSIDFEAKSAEELLRWSMDQYGLEAGLASSFGMEDMVLIDMIAKLGGPITLFTRKPMKSCNECAPNMGWRSKPIFLIKMKWSAWFGKRGFSPSVKVWRTERNVAVSGRWNR